MRMDFNRGQRCSALAGQSIEQRGLATWSRAHVQPGDIGPVDRYGSKREGDELTALVLDPDPTITNTFELFRGTALQNRRVRRPAPRGDTVEGQHGRLGDATGTCHEGGSCRCVVGQEQFIEFIGPIPECIAIRPHDPGRVGHRGWCVELCLPIGEVALADPPQHGVHESSPPLGTSGASSGPGQIRAGIHGGMHRDPHLKDLMAAQSQNVDEIRIDIGPRPIDTSLGDRVVQPGPTKCAVRQLGRKSGIAAT